MEHAPDGADPPDCATLVGRLLGHELAWEHTGIGIRAREEDLVTLAWSCWEAEGCVLAGPDADRCAYLAGFLEAYAAG
jgi:hypothetical protein